MSESRFTPSALLEAMIGAAVEAGRAAHQIYLGSFEVQHKADQSPVTTADHAAEAIILERLRLAAPGLPIVAEEEVAAGRLPAIGAEFFLVDPLDGTKEFIQRSGDFTVNIALVRKGDPVLGVVYAPVTAALYIGDVVAGKALRSQVEPDADLKDPAPRVPIRVRPAPAHGLTVVVSRSHSTPETETYLRHYPVAERVSVGSSLKFCQVASGEADLYPRLGPTMEWDTAAGHAVLVAAGGSVLAPGGAALTYGKPGLRNSFFIAGGGVATVPLEALQPAQADF